MSRRARQRAQHPRRADPLALHRTILRVARLDPVEVDRQIALVQQAVDEFTRGMHCAQHWLSLADTSNVAETLASMGLGSGPDVDRVITDAQRTLHDVLQRHQQRGSWTLYADEIDTLRWLAPVHRAQLAACSYGEFETAMLDTAERVSQARAGNAPAGAIVVEGQIASRASVAALEGGAA